MELAKIDTELYETSMEVEGKIVKIRRVHREYMCFTPHNDIDIVVFSKNDIKNINDNRGYYLLVMGKNSKTVRDYRPVECSHLIEIKNNFGGIKGKNLLNDIIHDFEKIRKVYEIQDEKPELYYIFFILWKIKIESAIQKQIHLLETIFKELKKEPNIKLFLYAWPEEIWNRIIPGHNIFEIF